MVEEIFYSAGKWSNLALWSCARFRCRQWSDFRGHWVWKEEWQPTAGSNESLHCWLLMQCRRKVLGVPHCSGSSPACSLYFPWIQTPPHWCPVPWNAFWLSEKVKGEDALCPLKNSLFLSVKNDADLNFGEASTWLIPAPVSVQDFRKALLPQFPNLCNKCESIPYLNEVSQWWLQWWLSHDWVLCWWEGEGQTFASDVLHHKMISLGEGEFFLKFFKTGCKGGGGGIYSKFPEAKCFYCQLWKEARQDWESELFSLWKRLPSGKTDSWMYTISFLCWQKSCHQRVTLWSGTEEGPSLAGGSTHE